MCQMIYQHDSLISRRIIQSFSNSQSASSPAAIFFFSQPFPSTRRVITIEAIVSPDAFKQVAAGSTKNPMVAIKGKASAGNPNRLTISISPTKPPPGAPERTKAL